MAAVHCGCNRIRIEVACASLEGESLLLDLELHDRWLVGGVARRGWLTALNAEQTAAFTTALAGFYKLAGVDVVREQVAALLGPEALFTVNCEGLVVWLGDAEVCYAFDAPETLQPALLQGTLPSPSPPPLARKNVIFSETALPWSDWAATWEQDRADKDIGQQPNGFAATWTAKTKVSAVHEGASEITPQRALDSQDHQMQEHP